MAAVIPLPILFNIIIIILNYIILCFTIRPNTRVLPGSLITGCYLTCFYCYFQEHFFYFQEAELRMDVLQQHAALMGGASTTSCPLCHKLFLGSESLVEHMKVHHNDPTTVSQSVVQSECKNIVVISLQIIAMHIINSKYVVPLFNLMN